MSNKRLRRPYARIRNKPERSVTEILDLIGKPGLPFAAANETAKEATYGTGWHGPDLDESYNRLRRHFRGVWDSRAAIGTATHAVMDGWFGGYSVDLERLVDDMAANETGAKSWRGREAEIVELLIGYVDGAEKWWNDWSPAGGTSEECVRTRGYYVGQRDRWGVEIAGRRWGLDFKTTAHQDAEKGFYADTYTLQLAAYRYAAECVVYEEIAGKIHEASTYPNEPVDACGVLHLRGDGEYSFHELPADDEAMKVFLALAAVVNPWLRAMDKTTFEPLSRPVRLEVLS
jgi:hypothetical protein